VLDVDQGEPVVTLAPHGLYRGRPHPRFLPDQLGKPANAGKVGVVARAVHDCSAPDHIVHHNDRPGVGQPERVAEVFGRARLVRIDEDQIERFLQFAHERGGGPDPDLDEVTEPRRRDVGAGDLRVQRIKLEGHDAAVGGQPPRQPDRAVAAERADLQHSPRVGHAYQQLEHPTLRRRDLDRRQASFNARRHGASKRAVLRYQLALDPVVYCVPPFLGGIHDHHVSSRIGDAGAAWRSGRVRVGEVRWVVQGVDAGCLSGVEVLGGDPFDPTAGAHADGVAVFGDQRVVEGTKQAHLVGVGQPTVLVLGQVMDHHL